MTLWLHCSLLSHFTHTLNCNQPRNSEGTPCCDLTAILSVCSETRSWLVRLSSSGPWPRWRARPTPGTSADGNVSPARRSAPGWRRCEAFSSWAAFGSGKGGRYDGSRRRVRGQLKRTTTTKKRIYLTVFNDSEAFHLVDCSFCSLKKSMLALAIRCVWT